MGLSHHFIFGTLEDILTGETIADTHDERFRQKIAGFLLNKKGYAKESIRSGIEISAKAGARQAIVRIDFLVEAGGKTCMMVRYAPGSITTRHRPSIAASRMVEPYQIPVVAVTNGIDADILDGVKGDVIGSGFEEIPDRSDLEEIRRQHDFSPLLPGRVEKESRILYTFDIDNSCATNLKG